MKPVMPNCIENETFLLSFFIQHFYSLMGNPNSTNCYRYIDVIENSTNNPVILNQLHHGLMDICTYLEGQDSKRYFAKITEGFFVVLGFIIFVVTLVFLLIGLVDHFHAARHKFCWIPSKFYQIGEFHLFLFGFMVTMAGGFEYAALAYDDTAIRMLCGSMSCTIIYENISSLANLDSKSIRGNFVGLFIPISGLLISFWIQLRNYSIDPTRVAFHIFHKEIYFHHVGWFVFSMLMLATLNLISIVVYIPSLKNTLEYKFQRKKRALLSNGVTWPSHSILKEKVVRYRVMSVTSSPEFVVATSEISLIMSLCVILLMSLNTMLLKNVISPMAGTLHGTESPFKFSMYYIFGVFYLLSLRATLSVTFRLFFSIGTNLSVIFGGSFSDALKLHSDWVNLFSNFNKKDIKYRWFRILLKSPVKNIIKIVLNAGIVMQWVWVFVVFRLVWLIYGPCAILAQKCFYHPPTPVQSLVFQNLVSYIVKYNERSNVSDKTIQSIVDQTTNWVENGNKKKPQKLLMLVMRSVQFNGVSDFDNGNINEISIQFINSWSIQVITLTCIAIAVNINKNARESLLDGVAEGISLIFHIEECVDAPVSENLWKEVYVNRVWLGKSLQEREFDSLSTREIIESFIEIARPTDENRSIAEELWKVNAAAAMYRVANTILDSGINDNNVFDSLCDMISDLIASCLTNIPALIRMKCEYCVIEERERNIKFVAKLVGKTSNIIDAIGLRRDLPNLPYDRFHSISEWRSLLQCMP